MDPKLNPQQRHCLRIFSTGETYTNCAVMAGMPVHTFKYILNEALFMVGIRERNHHEKLLKLMLYLGQFDAPQNPPNDEEKPPTMDDPAFN